MIYSNLYESSTYQKYYMEFFSNIVYKYVYL